MHSVTAVSSKQTTTSDCCLGPAWLRGINFYHRFLDCLSTPILKLQSLGVFPVCVYHLLMDTVLKKGKICRRGINPKIHLTTYSLESDQATAYCEEEEQRRGLPRGRCSRPFTSFTGALGWVPVWWAHHPGHSPGDCLCCLLCRVVKAPFYWTLF